MADSRTPATNSTVNDVTGADETVVVPDTSAEKTIETPAQTSTPISPAETTAKPEEKTNTVTEKTETAVSPIQQLWTLAKNHDHSEIWGVELADPETHIPSQIVLQKYLNANDGDLTKAKDQLKKTLDWRKEMKPLELLERAHSTKKFEGMGFVTSYGEGDTKEVFTWNIYGIVKDHKTTFGNLKEFIAWRVALMELALHELSISTAAEPITADKDPYKIFQVHDYKSVQFFRQSPEVKEASKETIKAFAQNYPELLREKFFVNVPAIMGAIYAFMKLFVAAKTVKKFHPMSNGGALANEFGDSKLQGLGSMLPKEYGGKGEDLVSVGKKPRLD